MTQKKASAKTGEVIKIKVIASLELFALVISPAKAAPRNVLPTSPMKTFAGSQFQNIKPMRAKTIKNIPSLIENAENKNTNIIFKQINPSNPSIKLMKFIMAVPKIINNNKQEKDS